MLIPSTWLEKGGALQKIRYLSRQNRRSLLQVCALEQEDNEPNMKYRDAGREVWLASENFYGDSSTDCNWFLATCSTWFSMSAM